MLHLIVVCAGVLAVNPTDAGPTQEADLRAYQDARASVGRDAEAHVRLALWCEQRGLTAEKLRHLALAAAADPNHAVARGLMGLVAAADGQWRRPEQLAQQIQDDAALAAKLAEYNGRRQRTAETADAQFRLARWCEDNGLDAEAVAHYTAVIRLDPRRSAAWRKLGYKRVGGQWKTEEQVAAEKAEAQAQEEADKHWKPLLERWKGWLGRENRRAEAEQELARVDDPRAVRAIWQVFVAGRGGDQARAVQLLGQIDAAPASRALAMLSLFGRDEGVRQAATATLQHRDPREFADLLIQLLRDPIRYEVRPVGGPGSPGVLFVEGQRFDVQRFYAPPPVPQVPILPGDQIGYDAFGLPVIRRDMGRQRATIPAAVTARSQPASRQQIGDLLAPAGLPASQNDRLAQVLYDNQHLLNSSPSDAWTMRPLINALVNPWGINSSMTPFGTDPAVFDPNDRRPLVIDFQRHMDIPVGQMALEAQRSVHSAREQLQNDINLIEQHNTVIREANDRILPILHQVAGVEIGHNREAWRGWWVDQLGFTYAPSTRPKPTYVQNVPIYQPQPVSVELSDTPISIQRHSCFGAGTPVHTLTGIRPIESLQVGDRVLSKDTKTGALSYQPVVMVHHNPPSPTYKIEVNDETIVSSPSHRFWKAGKGWVMARDLKPGDTLRVLGGLATVQAVDSGPEQLVYNLDVAEHHSFFVGRQGVLAHDNTLPDLRLKPFDAAPELASARPRDVSGE